MAIRPIWPFAQYGHPDCEQKAPIFSPKFSSKDYKTVNIGPRYEEVTSTVSIRTPELPDTNPCVWRGDITMPDVAKFSAQAYQVPILQKHHFSNRTHICKVFLQVCVKFLTNL
jgi:hypothetical protein